MTNVETWTEIPKFCRFFYKTEFNLFFRIKMSRIPSLIAAVPAGFVDTALDRNDDSQVGFKKPP